MKTQLFQRNSFSLFHFGILCLVLISGCGSSKPKRGASSEVEYTTPSSQLPSSTNSSGDSPHSAPIANKSSNAYPHLKQIPEKQFSRPLALDKILRPEDIVLVDSTSSSSKEDSELKKPFRIQLLSVADFEEAQIQKYQLSEALGSPVDVSFDAPFYKLRFGHFLTRQEADYRLAEIRNLGIQGFVVQK